MNKLNASLAYIWKTLCGEKMPVWLALLLIVAGAMGTYFIAPKLNEGFQLQVAKREFMVESMRDFASATKSFIDGVGQLVNQKTPDEQLKISLVAKAAELNFFAVQLTYVIPEHRNILLEFQKNVGDVQESIALMEPNQTNEQLIDNLKRVGKQSLDIYEALATKAGLGD